jgi:segregation and condensation protein B
MELAEIKYVIEAALLASGRPVSLDELRGLFGVGDEAPSKKEMREVIESLQQDYEGRGIEVAEVASGFRAQVRVSMSPWLAKLWEIRPPRFSRALMETLAIIAYRQPVTRGDVEDVRGVSVTPNIIRTLLERGWVRVVGHRDVPGKPEMFGTTKEFLDYFGLKKLEELPTLDELKDLDAFGLQLELSAESGEADGSMDLPNDNEGEESLPADLAMDSPEPVAPVVASLDAARESQTEAALEETGPGHEDEPRSATVVPLKAR